MLKFGATVLKTYAKNFTKPMSLLCSILVIWAVYIFAMSFRLDSFQTTVSNWLWTASIVLCLGLGYAILYAYSFSDLKNKKSKKEAINL